MERSTTMAKKQKISTFLWFDSNAEEAATFYTSIFPDSRVTKVARWGKGGPAPEGSVMTVSFELAGQAYIAMNGGPHYKLTPAISLFVSCESQEEVDALWDKLLAGGGKPTACGWLEDKFGLSWQVIPDALMERMSDPDPVKAGRVAQAMMTMQKIDIAAIERAYAGA
jgi:predicted 3-demethylubiquinone-9 3-methyltransferase (glyoxalase superfamily)